MPEFGEWTSGKVAMVRHPVIRIVYNETSSSELSLYTFGDQTTRWRWSHTLGRPTPYAIRERCLPRTGWPSCAWLIDLDGANIRGYDTDEDGDPIGNERPEHGVFPAPPLVPADVVGVFISSVSRFRPDAPPKEIRIWFE